jgi:hypothetical protein
MLHQLREKPLKLNLLRLRQNYLKQMLKFKNIPPELRKLILKRLRLKLPLLRLHLQKLKTLKRRLL